MVLEGAGATVTGKAGAREALAADGDFDVVISDIGMPEIDGYGFLRSFRASVARACVPAIALTAYAREEDADNAGRAGFEMHVAKPVDGGRLIEAVGDVVRQRSRRELSA
jgi:CheY-like chemotaxis protein